MQECLETHLQMSLNTELIELYTWKRRQNCYLYELCVKMVKAPNHAAQSEWNLGRSPIVISTTYLASLGRLSSDFKGECRIDHCGLDNIKQGDITSNPWDQNGFFKG